MDQVSAKKADAKALVNQIQREGEDLDLQVTEIKDNHESILVELEYSEKFEQELNTRIETLIILCNKGDGAFSTALRLNYKISVCGNQPILQSFISV